MPLFIQNVSIAEISQGDHFDCGDRAVLIQIMDYNYPRHTDIVFPTPKHKFASVHQFRFFDDDVETDIHCITAEQAEQLVNILKLALEERRNVIVHCHAGICRSGAVAEVGIMMGFADTQKYRIPNSLVKRRMMKVLGWTYDSTEPVTKMEMTESGIFVATTTIPEVDIWTQIHNRLNEE